MVLIKRESTARMFQLPAIEIDTAQLNEALRAAGKPGTITLNRLRDWRAHTSYWDGPAGPMVLGTWGDDSVFVPLSSTGLPCPVCRLLGGFHDDERHEAREVPRHLLIKAERAERVRLTDAEIAERRDAARQRREATAS